MPKARRHSVVGTGAFHFTEERKNFAEVLGELPRIISLVDGGNEHSIEQVRTSVTAVVVKAVAAIQPALFCAEREIPLISRIPSSRRGILIDNACVLLRSGEFDTFANKLKAPKAFPIPGDNSLEIVEWFLKFLSTLGEALDYAEVQWKERNDELKKKTAQLLEFKTA